MSRRVCSLLLAAGTCAAWCRPHAQAPQDAAGNPHYKQAQQDLESTDPNAAAMAADEYEAALPPIPSSPTRITSSA